MTEAKAELVLHEADEPERIEQDEEVTLGQWYWYQDDDGDDADQESWLGCITRIGTNYVKIESPHGGSLRVHLDVFDQHLRYEPNAEGVIQTTVDEHQGEIKRLMSEVKALTACLGVSPRLGLPKKDEPQSESYALAKRGDDVDMKDYKAQLIRAKDKELPDLFKQIKAEHKELAIWMTAETLPMKAETELMKGSIKEVEGRIFNVSLYAGLTEDVTQVSEGEPAGYDEKLHLMQRRLYMDEECLLRYEHGGMEFKDIRKFDAWMARPDNLDRLLPFPRCMIAMRVRRNTKDRHANTLSQAFINIRLAKLDKLTFLYIRNGEQLYRMNCDLEFDELLFPERGEFDLSEPQVINVSYGRVDEIKPKRELDAEIEEWEEEKRNDKRWRRKNPIKKWRAENLEMLQKDANRHDHPIDLENDSKIQDSRVKFLWKQANPYYDYYAFREDPSSGWQPFDPSTVYYDDAASEIAEKVQHYNRIALIIQGLYDRSPVLHPHPPVKTWTPQGFIEAIELIYDGSGALYDGEAPDFDAYSAKLRESLGGNSVTIGQEGVWEEHVQAKEQERRGNSYSHREYHEVSVTWKPDGDDGPGFLARVARFQKKARRVTFRWHRERRGKGYWRSSGDLIIATYTVEADELFNVSAYKPGDYLQFFNDPRTREDYLQWANLLLTAEEYHAGNLEPQEPAQKDSSQPSLQEMANRISAHLDRFERSKKLNKRPDGEGSRFYCARTFRAGRFVSVVYVSYQGRSSLTKGEAWKYLQWLDAGNVGRHYEQQREAEKARKAAEEPEEEEDYDDDEDEDDEE